MSTTTRQPAPGTTGPSAPGRPRLVLLDLDDWDSFASLAPAVRRRGMAVARVARRSGGLPGLLLDRLIFGRDAAWVDGEAAVPAALGALCDAPTADVQGPEELVHGLREAGVWPRAGVARRVPDDAAVGLLYDKLAMTRFAESVPVGVPRTWDTAPDGVWPLVAKGRHGSGGQAVRIVHDAAELAAAVAELDPRGDGEVFFQELCAGRLTNVGGVADRGRLLAGAAYRAIPRDDDPLGPPERLEVVHCPGIEADLPPLLEALGYSGFFCIDYFELPDGSAALIDFNPRVFAGWLALQLAGVDLLGAYLCLVGLAPPPGPRAVPAGERRDVRLLPRPGAASWPALRSGVAHASRTVREALPVTGPRFALAAAVRTAKVTASDALALARGRR